MVVWQRCCACPATRRADRVKGGSDPRIGALKKEGRSNRDIARRLGVTEKAVRKRLRRLAWKSASPPAQLTFPALPGTDPNLSGRPRPAPLPNEPIPATFAARP